MKYKTVEVVMCKDITSVDIPCEYFRTTDSNVFATYDSDFGFLVYDSNPELNDKANMICSVDEFECKGFNQNIIQSLDSIEDIGYNQF